MAKRYLMQARDSVTGHMVRWISVAPDFTGSGHPGPGSAEEAAVVAIAGEEDAVEQDLRSVMSAGNSAENIELRNLGAPQSPSSAARLSDITSAGFASEAFVTESIDDATEGLASESWVAEALAGLASQVYVDDAVVAAVEAAESYTDAAVSALSVPDASDATPQALGTAAPGSSDDYSRADHVHQLPAIPAASTANPVAPGTAAPGTSLDFARADHRHPAQAVPAPSGLNPSPIGTAAAGSSSAYSRADHVHAIPNEGVLPPMLAPSARTGRTIIKEISADHAITNDDYVVDGIAYDPAQNILELRCNGASSAITVTLPGTGGGHRFRFVKSGQAAVVLSGGTLTIRTNAVTGSSLQIFAASSIGAYWPIEVSEARGIWGIVGMPGGLAYIAAASLFSNLGNSVAGRAVASSGQTNDIAIGNGTALATRGNVTGGYKLDDRETNFISADGKYRVTTVAPSSRESATVAPAATFSSIVSQPDTGNAFVAFRTQWFVRIGTDTLLEFATTSTRLNAAAPVVLRDWMQLIGTVPPGWTITFVAVTNGLEIRIQNGSASAGLATVSTRQIEEYA